MFFYAYFLSIQLGFLHILPIHGLFSEHLLSPCLAYIEQAIAVSFGSRLCFLYWIENPRENDSRHIMDREEKEEIGQLGIIKTCALCKGFNHCIQALKEFYAR